jgi:hypothetical protein
MSEGLERFKEDLLNSITSNMEEKELIKELLNTVKSVSFKLGELMYLTLMVQNLITSNIENKEILVINAIDKCIDDMEVPEDILEGYDKAVKSEIKTFLNSEKDVDNFE